MNFAAVCRPCLRLRTVFLIAPKAAKTIAESEGDGARSNAPSNPTAKCLRR